MADDEDDDFASTNAQIIHILRRTATPMDAHSIYLAGPFDSDHTLFSALSTLVKKGWIRREGEAKKYRYKASNFDLPEYLETEVRELDEKGLPEPDPNRRIGMSRSEYEGRAAERRELREIKRTTVTEEIREEISATVVEPEPIMPPIVIEPPIMTVAEVAALPTPKADTPPTAPDPIADLQRRRDDLDAEIALMKIIAALFRGDGLCERVAFLLNDHAEILDCCGPYSEDPNEPDEVSRKELVTAARAIAPLFAAIVKNKGCSLFEDIKDALEGQMAALEHESVTSEWAEDTAQRLGAVVAILTRPRAG